MADRTNLEELLKIWEEERGPLPTARGETGGRLLEANARFRAAGDRATFLGDFRAAVRRAAQHPWPNQRPDFDRFIANDVNFNKVLDGAL